MSTGNSDGLGARRRHELYASYVKLGIHSENVYVLDHPDFQDDMVVEWNSSKTADVLAEFVQQLGISTVSVHGFARNPLMPICRFCFTDPDFRQ